MAHLNEDDQIVGKLNNLIVRMGRGKVNIDMSVGN